MTGQLTLFLTCILVIFQYDFGTFVMFSILDYVLLVFPKHSNFRGVLK